MSRRPAIPILLVAMALAGASLAWFEHGREVRVAGVAAFDRKRLALAEADNARLRELVARYERSARQVAQAAQRAGIEQATSRIRGLAFKRPVVYDVLTRDGIRKVLLQKLAEQYPDAEFEKARLGYVALGLIAPDYPLKQRYIDLLGEQVAAFYDQHTHRLFMFEDASLDSPQNRVILSHELTHALQDQSFELTKLPLEVRDNDDRALAASALVEGDATLEMNEFMTANISLKALREDVTELLTKDMGQLQAAPPILKESLLFPYTAGLQFCQRLHARNGFAAISAAFARPPASTAQILHPEKYLANEEPVSVTWPELTVLGEKPIADNVLGELGIRVLLGDSMVEARGATIAAAWRGDRYLVYDHGKALVWQTIWNTPEDAGRFRAAIEETHRVGAKGKGAPSKSVPNAPADPERLYETTIRQCEVLIVDAPNRRWADAAREIFTK